MRTIERMVDQEIICNVSALIAALAACWNVDHVNDGMDYIHERAQELCFPIQDWESAAREAGWRSHGGPKTGQWWRDGEAGPDGEVDMIGAASSQDACENDGIEPHEREIFEHWFVTEWLAERLEAKGERIDRDFAGHCVWGRTTSGQGIANDSVIEAVYADAKREYEELFPALAKDAPKAPPVPSVKSVMERAESFVSGFEGDELQEGVDVLLADMRAAIKSL